MWSSVTFRNFYCICRTIRAERDLSYHYAIKTGCHVSHELRSRTILDCEYHGLYRRQSYGKMLLLFNAVDDYAAI